MKNKMKLMMLAVVMLPMVFVMTACSGLSGPAGPEGPPGPPGSQDMPALALTTITEVTFFESTGVLRLAWERQNATVPVSSFIVNWIRITDLGTVNETQDRGFIPVPSFMNNLSIFNFEVEDGQVFHFAVHAVNQSGTGQSPHITITAENITRG